MNLHENKKLFADAVLATAQHLGIAPVFVEKDYWITRSLKLLSECDTERQAIFKGGTSLSKAYFIGARFSEDIDFAIVDAASLNGNQRKTLIKRLAKSMTAGLEEIPSPGITSKGSCYYKAIYGYEGLAELGGTVSGHANPVKIGQIMVEINTFANPYPYKECVIDNFINVFLCDSGNQGMAAQYGMEAFPMRVLDKRRTATEKLVSLLRFSLAPDSMAELSKKIRHFYDLYFLMEDDECRDYFHSDEFKDDLSSLLEHDRNFFDNPEGWSRHPISESPLFTSFPELWDGGLSWTYISELSALAYRAIPHPVSVRDNMMAMLERIRQTRIR